MNKEETKQAEERGQNDWAAKIPYDSNPYPFSLDRDGPEDLYWAWFRGWIDDGIKDKESK